MNFMDYLNMHEFFKQRFSICTNNKWHLTMTKGNENSNTLFSWKGVWMLQTFSFLHASSCDSHLLFVLDKWREFRQ